MLRQAYHPQRVTPTTTQTATTPTACGYIRASGQRNDRGIQGLSGFNAAGLGPAPCGPSRNPPSTSCTERPPRLRRSAQAARRRRSGPLRTGTARCGAAGGWQLSGRGSARGRPGNRPSSAARRTPAAMGRNRRKGEVHRNGDCYHCQEYPDSLLIHPRSCPTNWVHLR